MVMLKNPDEPATSKQLWLLHILTKSDTRNLKLTMQQASDQIEALKSGKQKPTTENHTVESKPLVEREVIQGTHPTGQTDVVKIQADFNLNAKPLAIAKLLKSGQSIEGVRIDFYDFNCKECLFGQSGICEPSWNEAGYTTCGGKVENVSFSCDHFESTMHSLSEYCHRPHGKQCHRKKIENPCLECNYRKDKFIMQNNNRTAWYRWIPTLQERLDYHTKILETWKNPPTHYSDINYDNAIKNTENIIRLLNKLVPENK